MLCLLCSCKASICVVCQRPTASRHKAESVLLAYTLPMLSHHWVTVTEPAKQVFGHASILANCFREDKMLKRIVMFGLLAVALASAKTYTFTISDPAQAGNVQLKPGEYHLRLDGTQVALMDEGGHQVDAAATVEESDRKFGQTSVSISDVDGIHRIESVQLGGSTHKVVFQQADQP